MFKRSPGAVDVREWQGDPKLGSAWLRLDSYFAVVMADETPDDIEAQTGALSHRLGSEEWVEDLLADLRGDAGPVVDDTHHHPLMLAARQHLDAAGFGDGIEGVIDQIRPDLVEFAARSRGRAGVQVRRQRLQRPISRAPST